MSESKETASSILNQNMVPSENPWATPRVNRKNNKVIALPAISDETSRFRSHYLNHHAA